MDHSGPSAEGSRVRHLAPDTDTATLDLPSLPDAFWEHRTEFSLIRGYAHAHAVGPEALLACVLARISALVVPRTVVDTGMLSPVRLNLFVGLVDDSGRGKSAVRSVARRFLPYTGERWLVAEHDGEPAFVERGLGSGEGICEIFMGSVPNRATVGPKGGRPRLRRTQVRHNALLSCDEGGFLITAMRRTSSSLGALLRQAWNEDRVGQQNGIAETTRDVSDHCLGLIIGFQPRPAAELFTPTEIEMGTPQRIFWCPGSSELPDRRPTAPPALSDWAPPSTATILRPPAGVCDQLYIDRRSQRRYVDPLDSQRPAMLCKIAGLLTLLAGRTVISDEDWTLAEQLYGFNAAVRSAIGRHADERDDLARDDAREERAASAAISRSRADSFKADRSRLRDQLVARVLRSDQPVRHQELRDAAGRQKAYLRSALDDALEQDLLRWSDAEQGYLPGLFAGRRPAAGPTTNGRRPGSAPRGTPRNGGTPRNTHRTRN